MPPAAAKKLPPFPVNGPALLRKMWQYPEHRAEIIDMFFKGITIGDQEINDLMRIYIRGNEQQTDKLYDFYMTKKAIYYAAESQ